MDEKNNTSIIVKYIDEIYRATETLKYNHNKHHDENLLIAYRGESKDYKNTKLMPSIFRDSTYIRKELHLFELLCDYNMIDNKASSIEKAIEAQHYIEISRMLDITFSLLSSLYFACETYNDQDAVLYVFGFPKSYSPHSNYIQDFYSNILEETYKPYSRNFKVFTHSYANERIKAQKGGFIFFPGKEWYPINRCYYEEVEIKAQDKNKIMKELDILFQVRKEAIYPEKANLAEAVYKQFISNSFDVQSSSVSDEIEVYFERLEYELFMTKETHMDILRKLRKEENDLNLYINECVSCKSEMDRYRNYIYNRFAGIKIRYQEV